MNIYLQWHGPFSIMDGTGLPNLLTTDAEAAQLPGVYLWTIPCKGEELIFYVGKAERTLQGRAGEEFKKKHEKFGYIPNPVKLLQGIKEWVYQPHSVRVPNEEQWLEDPVYFTKCWADYLQILRVFIAPMPDNLEVISDTETALMWAVWDYEDANLLSDAEEVYFLTNGDPAPRRLSKPFTIRMAMPTPFRGLGQLISG